MTRDSKFFTISDEHRFIQEGLRPHREEIGRFVYWHVFDGEATGDHDIYGEGSFAVGRRWKDPIRLPVLAALILESPALTTEGGIEAPDELQIVIHWRDQVLYGLKDLRSDPIHYKDRIKFEGKIWTPYEIQQYGEVKDQDTGTIVSAREVVEEQLYADSDFYPSA